VSVYNRFPEERSFGNGLMLNGHRYKDEQTLRSHSMTDHYKEFAPKLTEGGLLSEPPVFKASRPIGGFANC
jgi:quinol monooxygenase YgiN